MYNAHLFIFRLSFKHNLYNNICTLKYKFCAFKRLELLSAVPNDPVLFRDHKLRGRGSVRICLRLDLRYEKAAADYYTATIRNHMENLSRNFEVAQHPSLTMT